MPPKQQYVTAVAFIVVLATIGALWNVGAYRASLEQPAQPAANVVEPGVTPGPALTTTPNAATDAAATTRTPAANDSAPPTATVTGAGNTTTPVAAKDAEPANVTTATPTPTPDYDGDGIPDATDRCPTRPETFNGFKDGDGCPDIVATTRAS